MDKNVKKLGALAVILIALVGVYIATLNMGEKVEAEPEIAVEKIIDKEKDAIVAFRLSNGSDIEFNLKDGRWVMAEHEDFRLNNVTASTVALSLTSIVSQGTIDSGDYASFGLEPAQASVAAEFADGSKATLHIGKRTPDAKYYYAKLEGDQRIFTIAATTGERYFYGYNDFLNKSIPQIDVASIDYMEFKIGGNDYSFDLSFPYGVEYLGWFRKEYVAEQTGYGKRLNMQYVNQYMLAGLENIRLSGVVIDGAHNLAQYGLDDPVTMLHINDGENDLHFYLGATDESGLRYIMLEGENYVYTAQAAYFNAVESADMSGIFNRRLTDVVVKQAETVTVKGVGPDKVLKPNSNDDDAKAYSDIFEMNWDSFITPLEVENDTPIWTLETQGHIEMADINVEQQKNNDGNYEKQSDGSLKYTAVYEFYEYNDLFYAVSRDGKPAELAVSKELVDKVFTNIK